MSKLDKQLKRLEEAAENEGKQVNIIKATSDKAIGIIKELSGKGYQQGKKLLDNVILFTNAAGGTGASTIANNVAFEILQSGLSVVIVDLNIMCPVQHTYLGINQELEKKDLMTFLTGGASLNECLDVSGPIHLIFANNRTLADEINCNSKSAVENLNIMLSNLRNYYDVVIIDCPMRVDSLLCNTALYTCDSIYTVWDEGIGSIINTEKVRRNMALSGIDSYNKMRVILNKRTSVHFSDYSLKKLSLELVGVLPFSVDVIDNGLRGRIFCDKGVARSKSGAEFSRKIATIADKILKIGGYVK